MASNHGLYCLLTECSIKICIKMINITLQPFEWKWTAPNDKLIKAAKSVIFDLVLLEIMFLFKKHNVI